MLCISNVADILRLSKPKTAKNVPTFETNYNVGSGHRVEILKEINAHPVNLDRSYIAKTPHERTMVLNAQSRFKRDGLREWNERNRPGNNKTA